MGGVFLLFFGVGAYDYSVYLEVAVVFNIGFLGKGFYLLSVL